MANKRKEIEPEVCVTIRCGKKKEILEVWRFYSIVNVLRQNGASREESGLAATWARKAKPGDTRKLWPEITMEVCCANLG